MMIEKHLKDWMEKQPGYSADPKQHLKWQIEAIEENINRVEKCSAEEPHKTNLINELKREIELLNINQR